MKFTYDENRIKNLIASDINNLLKNSYEENENLMFHMFIGDEEGEPIDKEIVIEVDINNKELG